VSAASVDGAVRRAEFESVVERIAALEASDPAPGGARAGNSEVVTQGEFRLFKWLATFALAAMLGGFGLLYQQTADLRVEMRVLHSELRDELHTQISGLRGELHTQISGLRGELNTQISGLREQMHQEHTEIRSEIGAVRERVVRLEVNPIDEVSK